MTSDIKEHLEES